MPAQVAMRTPDAPDPPTTQGGNRRHSIGLGPVLRSVSPGARRPASPQIRVNIKGGMPTSASGGSRISGALALAARTLDATTQARVPPTARRVPARREAGARRVFDHGEGPDVLAALRQPPGHRVPI